MKPENGHDFLFQVYELCPGCEFMSVPDREYTQREVTTSRPCPTGCGRRLEVVPMHARKAMSARDKEYVAFCDTLAGGDWGATADDLALLMYMSDHGKLLKDPPHRPDGTTDH
ncbi:hypothetical protein ACIQCG_00735 [Streptomyces noursei]|uniref:hypothetical protein n=1 Tax=Streptomyces noursei TaxID=1971 RepID=UPI00380D130E